MPAKQLPVSRTGKPNPIDIHVGSRLRLRRTLLGLNQEKLGKAVGTIPQGPRSAWSNYRSTAFREREYFANHVISHSIKEQIR